ncbi:MAG: 6-phosphogluconolactonase [Limisphaerales bacterium]|jgi:6-phosphogluconolactonase
MGKSEIQLHPDPEALAAAAARQWLEELSSRAPGSGPYSAALSGGRVTTAFFRSIVDQSEPYLDALSDVHYFWADERCVPPDDPESNFRMAQELLFGSLGISENRIHRIQGELSPGKAAELAMRDLRNFGEARGETGHRFDMVFLGMGEDGHVASLFPGESEEAVDDPALYRPVVAVKPPPNRITLGYDAIVSARAVWALISGEGKRTALEQSIAANGSVPFSEVIRRRDQTRIITDVAL